MSRGFTLLFLMLLSSQALAAININSINFETGTSSGELKVGYTGTLGDYPDLKFSQNKLYLYIPESSIKENTTKKVTFAGKSPDTEVRLDSWKQGVSRVFVELPFNIEKVHQRVSVQIKDDFILVNLPKMPLDKSFWSEKPASEKVDKEILGESFLNSLEQELKENSKKAEKMAPADTKMVTKKNVSFEDLRDQRNAKKGNFNILEYGAKFAAFLGIVLLLFYGLVTMFKKGFIKRGKLGFLHKTDQVQVLSQTFIAPKKSLMLIKAHNQVFLVSNTDAGISLVSEISDSTGLIKEGERAVSGNNFDDSVMIANNDESVQDRIKLKEDIAKSNVSSSLSDYLNVKEKVKFSDTIKNKVKSLKPLQ